MNLFLSLFYAYRCRLTPFFAMRESHVKHMAHDLQHNRRFTIAVEIIKHN